MGMTDWFRPAPKPLTAAALPRSALAPPAVAAYGGGRVAEAWTAWRRVGEVHYATTQQARLISRLDWRVRLTPDAEPLDADQARAFITEAFGGQIREITKTAALHLQVAGAFQLARLIPGEPTSWTIVPYPPSYNDRKALEAADVVVLSHNADPIDPGRTDSPVLAALDVAQELMLARAQSRAHARSRTAQLNTVLYPLEGVPDPNEFQAALVDTMAAPLSDERSAASVVPNLIGFPAEYIAAWRTLDLAGADDQALTDRIEKLIHQLALQLDIPPELMIGLGGLSHWSSWLVQEDNWLGHVEPMAQPIAAALADAINAAAETEGIEVEPDPSRLMQRRPTVDHALTAYTYGLVDAAWTREQLGASDEDEPDELPVLPVGARRGASRAVQEPAITASAAEPIPDAAELEAIDAALHEDIETWLGVVVHAALTIVGATLRGTDGLPGDLTDSEVALWYAAEVGPLPGVEVAVEQALSEHGDQLDGLLDAAVTATREAGVALDGWDSAASQMLAGAVAALLAAVITDRAVDSTAWLQARRIVAVAGGADDPGPRKTVPTVGIGLALGFAALAWLRSRRIDATEWVWVHRSKSNPHPQHQALDRVRYDGSAIVADGVLWYPGDHAGCRCGSRPIFEHNGETRRYV